MTNLRSVGPLGGLEATEEVATLEGTSPSADMPCADAYAIRIQGYIDEIRRLEDYLTTHQSDVSTPEYAQAFNQRLYDWNQVKVLITDRQTHCHVATEADASMGLGSFWDTLVSTLGQQASSAVTAVVDDVAQWTSQQVACYANTGSPNGCDQGSVAAQSTAATQLQAQMNLCTRMHGTWNYATNQCSTATASQTDYTPWIIGGVLAAVGIGAVVIAKKRRAQ